MKQVFGFTPLAVLAVAGTVSFTTFSAAQGTEEQPAAAVAESAVAVDPSKEITI